MEEHWILDAANGIDLFFLHFVYLPRIQHSLNQFQESWNHHPVSTEGNKSPYQLWTLGMMDSRNERLRAVRDFLSEESINHFGIDPSFQNDTEHQYCDDSVQLFDEDLNGQRKEVLHILEQSIDRETDDGNFGIDLFLSVKNKVSELEK